MLYKIGERIRFKPINKNLILEGKILVVNDTSYCVEVKNYFFNFFVHDLEILEIVDENKVTMKIGSFCKKCNTYNEYMSINDYVCYSCRS